MARNFIEVYTAADFNFGVVVHKDAVRLAARFIANKDAGTTSWVQLVALCPGVMYICFGAKNSHMAEVRLFAKHELPRSFVPGMCWGTVAYVVSSNDSFCPEVQAEL